MLCHLLPMLIDMNCDAGWKHTVSSGSHTMTFLLFVFHPSEGGGWVGLRGRTEGCWRLLAVPTLSFDKHVSNHVASCPAIAQRRGSQGCCCLSRRHKAELLQQPSVQFKQVQPWPLTAHRWLPPFYSRSCIGFPSDMELCSSWPWPPLERGSSVSQSAYLSNLLRYFTFIRSSSCTPSVGFKFFCISCFCRCCSSCLTINPGTALGSRLI